MKLSRDTWLLLLLNVTLVTLAAWYVVKHVSKARNAPVVQVVTNYVSVFKSSRAAAPSVTNVIVATNDFRWAQLESEDYRDYIARLRSIGCPEQTIRDIIIADVDKMLAPKMEAASPRPREIRYWQPIEEQLAHGTAEQESIRKQRAVDFEKREFVRQLLGVDLVGERLRIQGQEDYLGQRLAFLPEDKRAVVRGVLDEFADKERELMEEQIENGDGFLATAELARIRQQKEAALSPLLSPEEREHYDLWFSVAAAKVRESVFGMNASEEEFLKLYALQREFDTSHPGAVPGSEPWSKFQQQVQSTLGEERFADWQRAQDPDFREIARVTARFKLAPAVAAELYSYKQPVEEERARLESDVSLTVQQREAGYRAISEEVQKVYKQALGDKAYRYYSRRTMNPWVRAK